MSKLKASYTSDLREQIKIKFKTLATSFKGAVTYAFYLLRCLFNQSRDTIASLKSCIALFKKQGLQRKNLKGENAVRVKKELLAVCKRLSVSRNLPDETTADILEGLQKCSNKLFRDLFGGLARDE